MIVEVAAVVNLLDCSFLIDLISSEIVSGLSGDRVVFALVAGSLTRESCNRLKQNVDEFDIKR